MAISFYARYSVQRELDAIASCLHNGLLHSDGAFSSRLRALFVEELGAPEILFTPSCTHALELACHLLGLRQGDEVILPSFNFPSAANAVLLAGGRPVLCDIDPDTQNLSPKDIARRMTNRTRAVIAVHYASVSCDMDALAGLTESAGISLIEDAAMAVGARYKGRPLGTIGRFGAYSFHSTKNFSCGEGGALVLRRDDLHEAEIFRDKGTNRRQYIQKESARYEWTGKGSSYTLSEILAALLLPQLESRREINGQRMAIHRAYQDALRPLAQKGFLRTMAVPAYAEPNGHLYYVRFATSSLRDHAMGSLLRAGIDARTHYVPLHLSPMGKSLGYGEDDLPESRSSYETLLRLPIHPLMSEGDALYVSDVLARAVS